MNEIQLGEAAFDVARIGAEYLTRLNNLVQEAVDPVAHAHVRLRLLPLLAWLVFPFPHELSGVLA